MLIFTVDSTFSANISLFPVGHAAVNDVCSVVLHNAPLTTHIIVNVKHLRR